MLLLWREPVRVFDFGSHRWQWCRRTKKCEKRAKHSLSCKKEGLSAGLSSSLHELQLCTGDERILSPQSTFYHYCIVRRDLPPGVLAAQLVHAAGESAQEVKVPPNTCAVVLAVPDETALLAVEKRLQEALIDGVTSIREPDEPYNGQITAIGIKPQPRGKIRKLLSNLPLYR